MNWLHQIGKQCLLASSDIGIHNHSWLNIHVQVCRADMFGFEPDTDTKNGRGVLTFQAGRRDRIHSSGDAAETGEVKG